MQTCMSRRRDCGQFGAAHSFDDALRGANLGEREDVPKDMVWSEQPAGFLLRPLFIEPWFLPNQLIVGLFYSPARTNQVFVSGSPMLRMVFPEANRLQLNCEKRVISSGGERDCKNLLTGLSSCEWTLTADRKRRSVSRGGLSSRHSSILATTACSSCPLPRKISEAVL